MYQVTKGPKQRLYRWNISWHTLAFEAVQPIFDGALKVSSLDVERNSLISGIPCCFHGWVVFSSRFSDLRIHQNKPVFSSMWHINWFERQYWGRCSGCTKSQNVTLVARRVDKKAFWAQSGKHWKWCWIGLWMFLLWWRFRMIFLYERHGRYCFASQKIEETCFGFGLTFLVVVCGRLHMLFKYNKFYALPSVRYPRVYNSKSIKYYTYHKQ